MRRVAIDQGGLGASQGFVHQPLAFGGVAWAVLNDGSEIGFETLGRTHDPQSTPTTSGDAMTSPAVPDEQQIVIGQLSRPTENEYRWAREWSISEAICQQVVVRLKEVEQERDGLIAIISQKDADLDTLRAKIADLEAHRPAADTATLTLVPSSAASA